MKDRHLPGILPYLTPTSIKFNRFRKLILLEHKPLLACFGFMTSQKWLVLGKINLRKRLNLIDVGAEYAYAQEHRTTPGVVCALIRA